MHAWIQRGNLGEVRDHLFGEIFRMRRDEREPFRPNRSRHGPAKVAEVVPGRRIAPRIDGLPDQHHFPGSGGNFRFDFAKDRVEGTVIEAPAHVRNDAETCSSTSSPAAR